MKGQNGTYCEGCRLAARELRHGHSSFALKAYRPTELSGGAKPRKRTADAVFSESVNNPRNLTKTVLQGRGLHRSIEPKPESVQRKGPVVGV